MKYLAAFLAGAALMILLGARAVARDVKVIANPSVIADSISDRDLKSIYLGEKNSLDGKHVEPVIERGGPAHEFFLREYLDQSDDELQKYYRTLVFTGRGSMPKAVGSDAEMVAYIAKTRGAIGYVDTGASEVGVRILDIAYTNGTERKLVTRVVPEYPDDLQKRSIGGTVRLKVIIAANGGVEHVELVGGNPILGESAVAAVAKWKYAAAASRTTTEIRIPFGPHE